MTEKTIKDGEKMVAILAIKPAIFINLNCWFYSSFCFLRAEQHGPMLRYFGGAPIPVFSLNLTRTALVLQLIFLNFERA
ncbi:hypothetical protein N8B80_15425 (plasmid) [Enterococcus faecium]